MNSAPQPRQGYYQNRPAVPTSAPRVQTSSGPRPVGPPHLYPPGSQTMMMIPQQQLSFAGSPQGYFIPSGQYRAPYMPPTQQYPVTSGTAGFYPGTSPAEYPAYAGAYYPAQPQYSPSVQPAPVMINPPQGPPKRERKPITIRDPNQGGRDITEEIMSGGRSTSTPTPPQVRHQSFWGSSPLIWLIVSSFNLFYLPDENMEPAATAETPPPPPTAETPPPPATENPEPVVEAKQEMDSQTVSPTELATQCVASVPVIEVPTPLAEDQQPPSSLPPAAVCTPPLADTVAKVGDTVDAPVGPAVTSAAKEIPAKEEDPQIAPVAAEKAPEKKVEEVKKLEKEDPVATTKSEPEPAVEVTKTETPPPMAVEEAASLATKAAAEASSESVVKLPVSAQEPAAPLTQNPAPSSAPEAKPTPAHTAEPLLSNGLPQDTDELSEDMAFPDITPVAKSDTSQSQETTSVATMAMPAQDQKEEKKLEEEKEKGEDDPSASVSCPAEESTMQGRIESKQWKPINPEEKKRYDREFLLGFQFISASMHKPEGLPVISDVVLDKANKTPLRPADPARLMNVGPDFTPSYLGNLGSRSAGGPRGPPPGPRRSQQGQRKEPRKIITSMSLNDDVQLNKAEKAWKPSVKKSTRNRAPEESEEDDPEHIKTQELFKRVRSILNKLTPQMFQQLMKQVTELTIDTEERLKGVIDLIFEKAISEPNFSVAYANMCRCLIALKVPTTDKKLGSTVNFRKLLLNRCQKEFEKDQDDDEILEKKQKELEAEESERLKVELEEARDKARRRSLGNIKFIGELFKLKMLTEAIMHDCVVKLLKNHDEESLECLCRLLSTIGKDLDFEKAKPRMDQYFNQMDKIIKERKTSSRIRFMLQDVLDLRRSNWVPRRGDQGPKTIDQIHKEAEMEEHREQIKVQQQLLSKKDGGGRMGGSMGGRGPHTPGGSRGSQPQDEGWNTVPISTKNRPIDTSRLSKITKVRPSSSQVFPLPVSAEILAVHSFSSQSWSPHPLSILTVSFSFYLRSSSSRERGGDRDRFDRFDRREGREGREGRDDRGNRNPISKRSFSRESEERGGRGGDSRASTEPVRRVASMTDDRDRGSRDRAASKDAPTPPPALSKPALTEEEVEKKSTAIIEDMGFTCMHMPEASQCVAELNSASLLFVFVRNGLESTLERSTIAREHMGLLLHHLVKTGILPTQQYYKGLQEILEAAEDMAIDIPHIWLYLAELITPMLHEGGIPMGQLFREISKPLVPLEKAGVLLVQILTSLCKGMTQKKVGAMWMEAGLNWRDFLPNHEDVNKFVTDEKVEFTVGEQSESEATNKKKVLSSEELSKQLDRLFQDKANNQRIRDWVEANLDEQQTAANQFVRALMTSVCQSAIICENPYKVDVEQITQRASLLQRYLCDEQKELQALYALQALMVHMEQPANLLRMFFDTLYDEDVIKEEAFYKWESSKDPAEQTGKGVALKSVTAFFTWLREAEEESDKD
uniref:Eukaryotic translation initiation factor 4 gamma, 1a n=1 Tax=Myripristis murdjan TaxID=586833 RepID=A0A667YWB1_9TELE